MAIVSIVLALQSNTDELEPKRSSDAMQCEGTANEIQGPLRQNAEDRQRFLSYLADLERTGRPFVVRNASVALASLSLPLMASHCGATRNDMYNQISSTWTPGSHLGRADRLLANAYLRLRCMLVAGPCSIDDIRLRFPRTVGSYASHSQGAFAHFGDSMIDGFVHRFMRADARAALLVDWSLVVENMEHQTEDRGREEKEDGGGGGGGRGEVSCSWLRGMLSNASTEGPFPFPDCEKHSASRCWSQCQRHVMATSGSHHHNLPHHHRNWDASCSLSYAWQATGSKRWISFESTRGLWDAWGSPSVRSECCDTWKYSPQLRRPPAATNNGAGTAEVASWTTTAGGDTATGAPTSGDPPCWSAVLDPGDIWVMRSGLPHFAHALSESVSVISHFTYGCPPGGGTLCDMDELLSWPNTQ